MKDLFKKIIDNLPQPLKEGEIVEGKVIDIGRSSVFLDLSPYGTGVIYGSELLGSNDNFKKLKRGDKISAKVICVDNEDGLIELSLKEIAEKSSWEKIERIKENDETIKVKILGANRGGLLTKLFNIPAFIPSSQLDPENYPKLKNPDPNKILKELQKFVGKEMEVKILSFSPRTGKLILTEKEDSSKIVEEYRVGDVVDGEITGIVDFGAFVKFWKEGTKKEKEAEGLIHISELDWQLIDDPSKVLKVGQRVKAKIIAINEGKVFLSLKALKEDPWKDIDKKLKKGDTLEGKVVKIKPYGAFIEIKPGIYGLCHISEFGSIEKLEEVLKEGKKYKFRISSLLPETHKMTLEPLEIK